MSLEEKKEVLQEGARCSCGPACKCGPVCNCPPDCRCGMLEDEDAL